MSLGYYIEDGFWITTCSHVMMNTRSEVISYFKNTRPFMRVMCHGYSLSTDIVPSGMHTPWSDNTDHSNACTCTHTHEHTATENNGSVILHHIAAATYIYYFNGSTLLRREEKEATTYTRIDNIHS